MRKKLIDIPAEDAYTKLTATVERTIDGRTGRKHVGVFVWISDGPDATGMFLRASEARRLAKKLRKFARRVERDPLPEIGLSQDEDS